jgi:hypothetical protein
VAKYCFAHRVARALSILTLAGLVSTATTRSARADITASDCIGFEQEEREKELVYHARNACERQLDCRMTYAVRCEDNKGRVTSSSALQLAFALAKNGSRDLTLSAKQCQQGWTIADVNWSCF